MVGLRTVLGCIVLLSTVMPVAASDRHAGYYYPEPTSHEVYRSRTRVVLESNRKTRIDFVTKMTEQLLARPYPPDFAVFAKGDQARKLIIVATRGDAYNTLFRARALLATLTLVARESTLFKKYGGGEDLTFFDLCKMHGFSQLTISDGRNFAHQVKLE